jgi:predicted peptidase
VWASYKQQAKDPAIEIWPINDGDWTDQYMELLDWFIARFSVDTNRIYVGGQSLGTGPTAGALGSRPDFFAAALMLAGVGGNTPPPRP